ncbi:Asp-tRNA(Asn)/Glu-tRNA(Gln) amidotransferase subunit GatA [Vagococcus elongatus]|uniref:Glutamyl-tRNA(Gln) amidotransferase subunit A n=1 Tax=Vagococcus elongatus TaxID=180344 RepID=A0A430AR57_9ENTE|nr:Asp-tRNA(Asn)/Glu-tRNA(Gln) amidotransferase subunit GatA [Vagococcus elongatus]RSU10525.1 aspartyl/glutamyl-tRNA amidotransferase subunit A [Vagococcus elongatus]
MSELYKKNVDELQSLLTKKEISAVELITDTFDRIESTEKEIDAFLTLNKENALKKAEEIDEKGITSEKLLAGIPISVKDNIVTKDMRTTAGSKMLENFVSVYDAAVIEKMSEAGLINVGKVNLDEFAMGGTTENSYFKPTKNAWDQTKVPGGSSGGSAASVASGQVPASIGSDTGGSIRQPAAFNGIVGMKPTYGRVSRYGLIAFASSLDQIGPLTRTVKDNALILNAISGHDPKDSTSAKLAVPDFTANLTGDIKGMKIAVPEEYLKDGVAPDVCQAVQEAIKTFESLGAIVEQVSLPHTKYGVAAYYIISSAEASSNLQRFDGIRYGYRSPEAKSLEDVYVMSRSEGFGPEVKRRIMLGTFSLSEGSYDAHFKKASQARTLIRQDFDHVFSEYDLIIGPTTPTVAYGFGEIVDDPVAMYMADVLTVPSNFAGLPGMSVPCGFSEGLPIGLQLLGKHFDEDTMYRAAYAFEQATDFHKKQPAILGGK